jgi:hypothetical protein
MLPFRFIKNKSKKNKTNFVNIVRHRDNSLVFNNILFDILESDEKMFALFEKFNIS